MDLHVERQAVQGMKSGDTKQFLLLFDAYFPDLYRYVVRRIGTGERAQEITRLTFLDALGQIQNTPTDIGYTVWLYSLARPRVMDQMSRESMPEKEGLIDKDMSGATPSEDPSERVAKVLKKLSLEEREIMRLKFFEEVSDGDVMTILDLAEAEIGPKIYRVLKRAHLLLFGESDEKQGVYFGELSGLMARAREAFQIEIPEPFKLGLRADCVSRIDRRDFAVEGNFVDVEMDGQVDVPVDIPVDPPFATKNAEPKGSNDPAKIFVEAVRGMSEEELAEITNDSQRIDVERQEAVMDFIDRWKYVLALIPVLIFLVVVVVVLFALVDFDWQKDRIVRGYPTNCEIEVAYEGKFLDSEKRSINKGVSDRLCEHFEVNRLLISRSADGRIGVEVDVPDWMLEYEFAKKMKDWRIKKYERTLSSNQEQRQV